MTHPTDPGPELTESDRAMLEALDTWRTEMGDFQHGYPETFAAWGAAWKDACAWKEKDVLNSLILSSRPLQVELQARWDALRNQEEAP